MDKEGKVKSVPSTSKAKMVCKTKLIGMISIFQLQVKYRSKMTADQREIERQKNNDRKKKMKESMSEEEKRAMKEKDRLRKKEKRAEMKEKQDTEALKRQKQIPRWIAEPRKNWDGRFTQGGTYREDEPEFNRLYKRRVRGNRTEPEKEYDKIVACLQKREKRQQRNGKKHLLENLSAKQGMRDFREIGPIKGREFMSRASREKDEEDIWYKFWMKGKDYKEILHKRRPDTATKMQQRYSEYVEKITDHRKKELERLRIWNEKEKELDAKGRWVWDDTGDCVVWSIPDEKGNRKRCDQPQDDDKGWGDNVMIEEGYNEPDAAMIAYFKEMDEIEREEINRKQRERRQKVREELSKPMIGPEQGEKGKYEEARDDLVRQRHRAMEESGLFNQEELQSMLNVIV